jgi:hypothetical protein
MSLIDGSNPSVGDLETDFKSMDMTASFEGSSGNSCGRRLVASSTVGGRVLLPSPATVAQRRTLKFLSSLSESPAKKRRLDNANRIRKLEVDRGRLVNKLKKMKQRLAEMVNTLKDSELERVRIDQEIAMLKNQRIEDD